MAVDSHVSIWKRFILFIKAPENAILLKISIFAFYGGAICVFPFFVLQMRVVGFTIKEIALIYVVIPFASLVGPIVSGMIADKWGKYNLVVAANMTLTIFFFNLLLMIPSVTLPSGTITCTEDIGCLFNVDNCENCFQNTTLEVTFHLQRCKYIGNESKTEIQMDHEKYSMNHKMSLLSNYTGNCIFNVMEIKPIESSHSSFNTSDLQRDIVCGIDWNTECKEKMKTLYSPSFWYFMLCKFCGSLFAAAAFTMTDASILALTKKHNLSVGKQKIMTMLSFSIMPIISGILIDYHSNIVGYKSYFAAFMLATALFCVSIIIMIVLKIEAEKGSGNMIHDAKKLVTHKEVVLFYVVLLILGTNFGFIESYIFIYLTSLGASGFLLGFTLTVGCSFSIPMLFYADKLREKFGRRNIYLLCFTCYAIRMIGYSYIWNPWMGLCFEVFEAFTYQLMWVTSLNVFPLLTPKGLLATMTGIAGAIHYSFGKGIGGFIGGQVIEVIGMRLAFRYLAIIPIGGAVFYYAIDKLVLEEKFAEKEREQKEEEMKKKLMEDPLKEPAILEKYYDKSNEKHEALLAPNEKSFTPLEQVNKKSGLEVVSGQANIARSMPHLCAQDELNVRNRHSVIGAWISSEKLYY